jgi:hypothetical protein
MSEEEEAMKRSLCKPRHNNLPVVPRQNFASSLLPGCYIFLLLNLTLL